MIAYLLLILLVAILAYFEARREKRMIDACPGGPDLDHNELIWRRLRNVGALVMVAVVCDGTEGWDALWMGLCHAGAAWATFTGTHRLSLNLMRGMDWRYVSPGNLFDKAWITFVIHANQLRIQSWNKFTAVDIADMLPHHGRIYNDPGLTEYRIERDDYPDLSIDPFWYRKHIHRAGTLAYIFELTVLAASIVGAIATLTNT